MSSAFLARAALCALATAGSAVAQRLPVATLDGLHEPSLWTRFGVEDGLPNLRVLQVHETWEPDSTPRVWVVTEDGVAWYDGHRWHPVGRAQGLPEEAADDLAVDSRGEVIALFGGHAFVGNSSTGFVPLDGLDIPAGDFAVACEAIPGGGLAYLLRRRGSRTCELRVVGQTSREPALVEVMSLDPRIFTRDAAGAGLWLAAKDGLRRLDGKGEWWLRAPIGDLEVGAAAVGDAEGRGLAYVDSPWRRRGLWEWTAEGHFQHVELMDFDGISGLTMRPDGEAVVVLTSGEVRVRADGHWGRLDPRPREMRGVRDVSYRANGDLWVATDHGLFLWRREHPYWAHIDHGQTVRDNLVLEYCRARDGTLWVGKSRGVVGLRPDGTQLHLGEVQGLELHSITALAEGPDGSLWIASGTGDLGGALRWDGQEFERFGPAEGLNLDAIHKIRGDRAGGLWFLGLGEEHRIEDQPGAWRLDPDGTFEVWNQTQGLPSGRVYDFLEGPDGERWFATLGGLSRWSRGSWTHWSERDGLKANRVFTLALNFEGRLWFGHESSARGLGWIGPDDRVHYTRRPQAAANARVNVIRTNLSGRKLWIGTDRGLFHHDGQSWTRFTSESGMRHDFVRALLVDGRGVMVGTHGGGTSRLNFPDPVTPAPVVELAEPVVEGREALLRWWVHTWWGEQSSERVPTRYRVAGQAWSDWSTRREASLRALPYGAQHFEVQAKDFFGHHGLQGFSATIHVARPTLLHTWLLTPVLAVLFLSTGLTALLLRRRRRERVELRDSEERFRQLAENVREVFWLTDWQTKRVLYVSPAYEQLTGSPAAELYRDPRAWKRHVHPDDLKSSMQGYDELALSGEIDVECRMLRPGGELRWVRARAFPVRDERGQVFRVAGLAEDITDSKLAADALAESEERYRALVEAIPDAILLLRGDRVGFANPAAVALFGAQDTDQLEGTSTADLIHEDDRGAAQDWLRLTLADALPGRLEARARRMDGAAVEVELTGTPVEHGGERGVQVVMRDVTERRHAQERQTRLMRELDHRVKNSLAGVLALAQQTLRGAVDLAQFERAFTGRVRAMARAHEALASSRWEGVRIVELVQMVLSPFDDNDRRVSISGPEVALRARAVAPLGMALHELATNAAKYGALSKGGGQVDVTWERDGEGRLHLRWAEEGCARVSAPDHEGLGLSIVRGVIEYELGGSAGFSFAESGVQCDLWVPADRLHPGGQPAKQA
jgi:PAS domain S-box-containing protein